MQRVPVTLRPISARVATTLHDVPQTATPGLSWGNVCALHRAGLKSVIGCLRHAPHTNTTTLPITMASFRIVSDSTKRFASTAHPS
jgi:hypothetical protein